MKASKTKNNKIIFLAIVIIVLIIILSFIIIKNTTGNATKMLDSKQETALSVPNTQKLTEFNIPTREKLDSKSIAQTFKENTEIELKLDKSITALSVTGNATLLSEAALVRIILVNEKGNEYLVYEISSLLSENKEQINFENTCEETCVFEEPITAVSMKIQVEDAALNLSSINKLSEGKPFTEIKGIESYKQEILKKQSRAKIEQYNLSQKSWTAGETSVSNLSYEEQKRLFTREDGTIPEYLPNLQGFLNYKGGIFTFKDTINNSPKNVDDPTIQPPVDPPEAESNIILPDSWDWRNVHGKNWMTPVKNQGNAGTCWSHAMMGTLESEINLYYNQHFNLDLSEQMAADCPRSWQPFPNENMDYDCLFNLSRWECKLIHAGISDESCDPYAERLDWSMDQPNCNNSNICSNWDQRTWRITDWITHYSGNLPDNYIPPEAQFNISESKIKKKLITNGPQVFDIEPWNHSVILVGYILPKWQLEQDCNVDSICVNGSCISKDCNNDTTLSTSFNGYLAEWNNDFNLYLHSSGIRDYTCNGSYWLLNNITYCQNNEVSINEQCISNYQLNTGFNTCSKNGDKILIYNQSNEIAWIFKNSWGLNWGDNGYCAIVIPRTGYNTTTYVGPITPPTDTSYWPEGFNNTINCEDKDGDQYCNWGISEQKPSTCPAFCNAEKDCDDSNPDLLDFISKTNLNCKYKYETEQ